jgi:hypothetical protein
MSIFPEIIPNSIEYDHGTPNLSEYNSFGLGPIRFRHSSYIYNQSLRLTYRGLSQAQVNLIRDHYAVFNGTSFEAPLSIWGGASVVLSDSTYRYADTPTEEHTGLHYNLTVDLLVLKGYLIAFFLDSGSATVEAESAFSAFVFSGTAPFTLDGTDSATATLILNGTDVE